MTDGSRLLMSQGPEPDRTFALDQDYLTLGRDPSNDIVISDPQVSRQHARIMRQGDLVTIEDMGSTNGTFVNGVRLTDPHTLADGNVISLGDTVRLVYHGADVAVTEVLDERPAAPSAAPTYEPPPARTAPPPPTVQPIEEPERPTWLWVGCGCLVLLVIAACMAVFVLDYVELLPAVFYEPLRWLGLL
jgi:pSer/pThr/pTyr-binding forkhead associated (FHA) protein